jgi:hypothetical protein
MFGNPASGVGYIVVLFACRLLRLGSRSVAIQRIRIDYTVYPPDFKPGESPCWDFRTFTKAKFRARVLGVGARVYRNFNQTNKRGQPLGDWWGDKYFWRWTGTRFQRCRETGEQVGSA